MTNQASSALVFAWSMFVGEMEAIEMNEPHALQVLQEAVQQCAVAGISVEALVAFAEDQNIAREVIPIRMFLGEGR